MKALLKSQHVSKTHFVPLKSSGSNSALTKMMTHNSFINQKRRKQIVFLPRVPETDPNYKKLKVYFFGTAQFTFLPVSKTHKIGQLIMHIIGMGEVDPFIGMCFEEGVHTQLRANSKEPELYEMRLLADEEDPVTGHIPLYQSNALNRENRIGAFLVNSLAFCRTKEYEETVHNARTSIDFLIIELGMKPKEEIVSDLSSCRAVTLKFPLENTIANSWGDRGRERVIFNDA